MQTRVFGNLRWPCDKGRHVSRCDVLAVKRVYICGEYDSLVWLGSQPEETY